MPTYEIEMLWTCAVCKHADNRGLAKHCANCGKPKDDRDEERFPDDLSEANALHGDDARRALAGPDWKCRYCGSLQNSLGPCCTECGSDKATGAKPWQARTQTITEDLETGRKTEILTPSAPPVSAEIVDDGSEWAPRVVLPWRLPLVGILTLLIVALGLWLLFRTRVVDAHVSALAWQHRVVIDRYQVWHRDGWESPPDAFDAHPEGLRIHHYDHVRVGSHQEAYPESYTCGETCVTVRGTCSTSPRRCTRNNNGTANCTGGDRTCSPDSRSCSPKTCTRTAYRVVDDYEEQARYRTWYAWSAWDWGYNRTVQHTGVTLETSWPTDAEVVVPLAPGEKERSRQEASYRVTFAGPKDTYTIEPKSIDEFRSYPIGRPCRLNVSVAGGVSVVPEIPENAR